MKSKLSSVLLVKLAAEQGRALQPQSWLTHPWIRFTHLGTGAWTSTEQSCPAKFSAKQSELARLHPLWNVGGLGRTVCLSSQLTFQTRLSLPGVERGWWESRVLLINLLPRDRSGHLPPSQPLFPQNAWFRSHFRINEYIPSAHSIPQNYGTVCLTLFSWQKTLSNYLIA